MNIYDFKALSTDGKEISFSDYKGKALLIVNVASRCGYTPQYEGLENLYKKYGARTFLVLGFPCNQFGGQEPGSDSEIKSFCEKKYGVTFPLFAKIEVNGPLAHPLYAWLVKARPGIFGTEAVKWNFTKFLIDPQGSPVKRYAPSDKPEAIEKEIEQILKC